MNEKQQIGFYSDISQLKIDLNDNYAVCQSKKTVVSLKLAPYSSMGTTFDTKSLSLIVLAHSLARDAASLVCCILKFFLNLLK